MAPSLPLYADRVVGARSIANLHASRTLDPTAFERLLAPIELAQSRKSFRIVNSYIETRVSSSWSFLNMMLDFDSVCGA
jgi:hypothetical protein